MLGSGSGLFALTCFDWSYSGSDRSSGALGNWSVSGATWTVSLSGRGVIICDGLAPLACFQQ